MPTKKPSQRSMVKSIGFSGLKPYTLNIEVDVKKGLPKFTIIGLAQNAVQEGKSRIITALRCIGVNCDAYAITVNLMPAAIKKNGTLLDLPIAVAILQCLGYLPEHTMMSDTLFVGELSLQGKVLPITGAMAACLHVQEQGFQTMLMSNMHRVPQDYFSHKLKLLGVGSLEDLVALWLEKKPAQALDNIVLKHDSAYAWRDIKGQRRVKRALQIAVSGEHNVLLLGPPGVGKSYMAKRLNAIYPAPDLEDQKEILKIKSFCQAHEMVEDVCRPFQMPHHTSSLAGMVGGGRPFSMGEFTRAHKGILCLDEITEFRRDVLESLREPLENHEISVVRSEGHFVMPAQFMLVATSNLCPCGGRGENQSYCECSNKDIQKYMNKISKPVRERIDMVIYIPKISWQDVQTRPEVENNDLEVKHKIFASRKKQAERYVQSTLKTNARVMAKIFWANNVLSTEIHAQIETWVGQNLLSFRRIEKMLRVARSIADYENSEALTLEHVREAYYFQRWPEIK